jgi:type II pantothenate kinase
MISLPVRQMLKKRLQNIQHYLTKNSAYRKMGQRDTRLQMDDIMTGRRKGTLHFFCFPACEMGNFLELAKSKGLATLVTTVSATVGGAYKFEDNFQRELNVHVAKFDEFDLLIHGILYVETSSPCECYYWIILQRISAWKRGPSISVTHILS